MVKLSALAATAVGAAIQSADALAELTVETTRRAAAVATAATAVADRAYRDATRRGELAARACAERATRHADAAFTTVADTSARVLDHQVVRRVAASMQPYLIDELVPAVIEGVLPLIRTRVVPLIIADLAQDEQIRTMIAQQSRGMAAWTVAEVRRVSTSADARVEVAARRMLRRRRPADAAT